MYGGSEDSRFYFVRIAVTNSDDPNMIFDLFKQMKLMGGERFVVIAKISRSHTH